MYITYLRLRTQGKLRYHTLSYQHLRILALTVIHVILARVFVELLFGRRQVQILVLAVYIHHLQLRLAVLILQRRLRAGVRHFPKWRAPIIVSDRLLQRHVPRGLLLTLELLLAVNVLVGRRLRVVLSLDHLQAFERAVLGQSLRLAVR